MRRRGPRSSRESSNLPIRFQILCGFCREAPYCLRKDCTCTPQRESMTKSPNPNDGEAMNRKVALVTASPCDLPSSHEESLHRIASRALRLLAQWSRGLLIILCAVHCGHEVLGQT